MRPGEGKEPLVLHLLHRRFPLDVFIAGMSDPAARDLAGHKWSIQFHAKPLAKLAVISQSAPHPRNRRFEFDALLNTSRSYKQPPGCILTQPAGNMQLSGCPLYCITFLLNTNQDLKRWQRNKKRGRLAPSPSSVGGQTNFIGPRDSLRRPGDRDGGGPRIRRELPSGHLKTQCG